MPEVLGTDPGSGISGLGTTIAGSVSGAIGMVTKIGIDGQEADEYDITTMNNAKSDLYKRFIAGLIDAHGASLDLLYERINMNAVLTRIGKASETWTITFPDMSTFVVQGFIKKLGTAIPYNEKITQSCMLRFTGAPTFNAASGG